ncbi:MAG: anthranilate phosphoribosyltransferase [Candidatus Pacearchaeota archaeon]|nr:MAG: anthranilate phosphoribosyltransferase [Candidatus Pacearchaeota archaeon]
MKREIVPILKKISNQEDLTAEEAKKAFKTAFSEKEGDYFTALSMGLVAKGVTSNELLGFCKSFDKIYPKIELKINATNIIDNSGTGGSKLKTFNISTTAAFIISAIDISVAKQSFFSVTGVGGSADLFRNIGIDVIKLSRPNTIKKIIEKVGIVSYIAAFLPKLNTIPGLINFAEKQKAGLKYITPLHLAANISTPIKMENRLYGVFDEKYLNVLAELFQKLDYKRVLLFCGLDGIDEISNIGKTKIIEIKNNKVDTYVISPEDIGIRKARYEDIKAISAEQNVIDFLRILHGIENGPKRDVVLVNSAAAFYIMNKVKTIKEGVELARNLLDEGKAANKLKELVNFAGDIKKLNKWKKIAKI